MGNAHFAQVPNISIPRSRFNQPFTHSTTFQHGKLIPIDCFEIISGDTYKLDLGSLIRMNTPITALFGNIKCFIHAFFCPSRILWDKWEEFFGANKTSANYQTSSFVIPMARARTITDDSVAGYLGKPVGVASANAPYVSLMKERAYWLTWSEWYRAEQIQAPLILKTGSGNDSIGYIGGTEIAINAKVKSCCKMFDYFTSATLSPQYGASVTLPLGSYADVYWQDDTGIAADSAVNIEVMNTGNTSKATGTEFGTYSAITTDPDDLTPIKLRADLANATAATINSIRYAFAVQKYLERANFGQNRYFEILKVHYGVTSPDARLQRPEYLGGTEFYINVQQVLSTAGSATDGSQKVGQVGATSMTFNKSHIFTKSFVEPGYVIVMLETKHERLYSGQGVNKEDTKFDRFDYYTPEFANLGDQAILNKEIMATGSNDDDVFGYQESWAEYRYRPNRVSGKLIPGVTNALGYWTLAENFATRPSLNENFILEDRTAVARCLTTGSGSPFDYIADFAFHYQATRELPLYGIPGLVDHFGAM